MSVHEVPFAGSRSGTFPCTWGQLDMWREIQREGDPAHGNVVGGGYLPPGHSPERVMDVLRALVERHDTLRTRFRPSDDGRLVQHVAGTGVLPIEVHDLGDDPEALVGRWAADFQSTPYDLAADLPFQVRIGTAGPDARLLMFGTPHLTVDMLGSRVLFDELLHGLDGMPPPGPPGLQPAEVAELERSTTGRRTLRRALDHWRAVLDDAPPAGFTGPEHAPESTRYWQGGIVSRAVPRAVETLAARYGVSTSHVLLGAMAALVGRRTGAQRCLVRMVVGNRGRPELRNAVGSLSQEVVASVDLVADRFEDLVRAARVSALRAMRHGRYDPDLAAAIVAGAGAELDVYFNDMWSATRGGRGAPGGAAPATGTEETVFAWEERLERASVAFFFEVHDVINDPAAVRLSLLTDTAHVPASELRELLFAVERTLVALVADDAGGLDRLPLDANAAAGT
ncbi:hypothetical protein J4573_08840 [Actinomadura barringtoniae]|uniref:Condensation domain-containing protein n=1 Tax=Actinomadura barringtoniae TaxID=1427535 RepID=A0A939T2V6_9ACTN|nr:condensation domain-containing protein [Actinomadura barringtoniae]MBO2447188.1 hypothetical protein [Actinomadura barringtoniae]